MRFTSMKRSSLACSLALAVMLASSTLTHAYAANSLPSGMTFFTTEKMYVAGQTVNVVGQIHSYSGPSPMLITVYAPDGRRLVYS
jgi:multidrug resistance efflux pump